MTSRYSDLGHKITKSVSKVTPNTVNTEQNPKNTHQIGEMPPQLDTIPKEHKKVSVTVTKVCQICLRTDFECTDSIDGALMDLHDELVYYDMLKDPCLQYCALCRHLLRKVYNFRQQCRRAHMLLKGWFDNVQKPTNQKPLETLQSELPKPITKIGLCTARSRNKVYDIVSSDQAQLNGQVSRIKRSILIKKIQHDQFIDIDPKVIEENTGNSDDLSHLDQIEPRTRKLDDQIEPKRRKLDTLINNNDVMIKSVDTKGTQNKNTKSYGETSSTNIRSYLQSFRLNNKDMCLSDIETDAYQEYDSTDITLNVTPSNKVIDGTTSDMSQSESSLPKHSRAQYMKEYNAGQRAKFKASVMKRIEEGEFSDITDQGTVLTKEVFAELFDKTSFFIKRFKATDTERVKKFLEKLLRKYNPVYESVFEIEHLSTPEMAVEDFRKRKDSAQYLEAQFKCELCYRIFESQNVVTRHKEWHDPKRSCVCDICPMRFHTRRELIQHACINHAYVFRCKFCPFYTNIRSAMEKHFSVHAARQVHTSSVFECHTCNTLYASKELLHQHQRVIHGDHQVECSLCGHGFASHDGRTNHVRENHADATEEVLKPPTERCEHCAASFHRKVALDYHVLERHTLTEADRLSPGGHGQWQAKQLSAYLKKATNRIICRLNSKMFVFRTCYICDEVVHRYHFYEHFTSRHPFAPYAAPDKKLILCELCGKYLTAERHKDHMNVHIGHKPYECSECGARFARRKAAAKHVERHGGPRYPCQYCDKLFHTRVGRANHSKIHTKERKYRCTICDKGFIHPSKLKYHINGVHRKIKRVKNRAVHKEVLRSHSLAAFVKIRHDGDEPVKINSEELPNPGFGAEELQDQNEELELQYQVFDEVEVQHYVEYEAHSDDEVNDE